MVQQLKTCKMRISQHSTATMRASTIQRFFLALLASFGLVNCSFGSPSVSGPKNPAALNILFIGNSLTYTNNLPGMLSTLITTANAGPVEVASASYPDFGLMDHWSGAGDARAAIAVGGWDVVILQQGPSATEGRPSLLEYSALFAEEARKHGATPAIYMVWPARARFFDFDGVSESHRLAADAIDGLLFPVGEAWRAAWAVDSTLALYASDQFHPSVLGSYLAAVVMFEQLTGISPDQLPIDTLRNSTGFPQVDTATYELLHQAAIEANKMFARDVAGWPSDSK